MKRITIYSAFAAAALLLTYKGTAMAHEVSKAAVVAGNEGDPCEVGASRKMSGYLVSTGRAAPDNLECRAAADQ